jgi:transposase
MRHLGFVMDPKNWTQTVGVVKSRKEVLMAKRRTFSPEFKVRVVLDMISGEKGVMQASRDYGIKDTVLSRWKQDFLERAVQLFEQPKNGSREQERIAELERMVGRLTMQLDMAKKVLRYSGSAPKDGE